MSKRTRLLIDVGAFLALLIAYNPAWSGIGVHEWVSVAVIAPLFVHLVINWDWTLRVAGRFFERLRRVSRVNLVVDAGLFVATVTVMLSGLMVSRVLASAVGATPEPSAIWVAVHSVSADATMALLLVHFALHWSWVARGLGVACTGTESHVTPEMHSSAAQV